MSATKRVTKTEATKTEVKKRVAAYCRVSTDKDSQEESLENQMEAFRYRLAQQTDWELVDIYADEGLSGTSVKGRERFREMIADCEAGKIDYILTKSISRFARNTLDCIEYVRKLKGMGIGVFFEKEGVDTGDITSEMILTIMASFAQEESRSISENVKWGIRKRFEEGKGVKAVPIYGFQHTREEAFLIEPREAEVVREVFERYVHGELIVDIMSDMMERGIKPPAGKAWKRCQMDRLITNEHYAGDVILQKTFIENHLTHKQIRNRGELPTFYVENAHAAIVERRIYDLAQTVRAMRGDSTYPYGEMLKCPHCGQPLVHGCLNDFHMSGKRILNGGWGCYGKGGCRNYLVIQDILDKAVLEAWARKHGERMERVDYYWLADKVENIELGEEAVAVYWKDGNENTVVMEFPRKVHQPTNYADFYNERLAKVKLGEIRIRSTCPMGL